MDERSIINAVLQALTTASPLAWNWLKIFNV
jgi:hypothetical protein